ncbi:MAG: 50S ribosomal protein L10 [Synechocystis sp.]|jgi:large subunit ribosomal protein L10|nr:50S ribosomal protein L10 [Synechocystis sp.]
MGRTRENKAAVIAEVQELIQDAQMAMVIDYQGLTVAEITDLRGRLRPLGGTCKIAKNTLVNLALEGQEAWQPMQEFLTGTTAIIVLKDDLGGAIKAYKKFQKETKKTELRGGVLEGKSLTTADVEAIGDLPSKEQLMGQIAGGINALATKIALGIKEVPASVARGLQAHVDKE